MQIHLFWFPDSITRSNSFGSLYIQISNIFKMKLKRLNSEMLGGVRLLMKSCIKQMVLKLIR